MATRRPAEPNEDVGEDEDFSIPDSEKPKTGRELYLALVENGFIGAWKDRTDLSDSVAYARKLRERASKRHHDE